MVTKITTENNNGMNISVIGYYNHYNIGDDQYKESFGRIFRQYLKISQEPNVRFIDCDRLHENTFGDDEVIILGGGDILNGYFMNKVVAKFTGCRNKIIALSVGLPYKDTLVNTNLLSIIDYIFIRTTQDLELFSQYFHPHRVLYMPDISCILTSNRQSIVDNKYVKRLETAKSMGKRIVSISLSRHIYNERSIDHYNSITNVFGQFVKMLLQFDFHVVFLPFNTNGSNTKENDILIHQDVLDIITKSSTTTLSSITFVDEQLTTDELLAIFDKVDVSVPMRFHACLFSIYTMTPFFPVFTTRKIKNLLLDISWCYGYELETDSRDVPTHIDMNVLAARFICMTESLKSRTYLYDKLNSINVDFYKALNTGVSKFIDAITIGYSKSVVQSLYTSPVEATDKRIDEVWAAVQQFIVSKGYNSLAEVSDEAVQQIIVSIVSYNLTNGCINSSYTCGLKQKMFDRAIPYNYREEWKWILRHNETANKRTQSKLLLSNPYGLFDMAFVDQNDYSGAHRSGWQYVFESVKYLHNENSDLLLDLYVDRTFHWNLEINRILGIVPYRKHWIGFIHHTFDTTFSDYNCWGLLQNEDFRESLKCCRGLIVLSGYLKKQLETELQKQGFTVPVHVLMHPTDMCVPKFSMKSFLNNGDKKLIQIGGWLRNTYVFYCLTLPKQIKLKTCNGINVIKVSLRKVCLLGKHMSNYHPSPMFLNTLHSALQDEMETNNYPGFSGNASTNANISTNCSRGNNKLHNNWYKHFYEDISHRIKGVDYLQHVNNAHYDTLLTENIVFVSLVDASAINTLIECVVRNTPIIISKLPAVVEVLGESYPLYIRMDGENGNSLDKQVERMLSDHNSIRKAHQHLKGLDKSRLNIQMFVKQFVEVVKKCNG
jgi:polysaccharide pyruvyl transferase WcaK-like protein